MRFPPYRLPSGGKNNGTIQWEASIGSLPLFILMKGVTAMKSLTARMIKSNVRNGRM